MTTINATVRNRRIEVPAPNDMPDGAEVTLTIAERNEDSPMPPEEIARVLAAMENIGPWNVPEEICADLDE